MPTYNRHNYLSRQLDWLRKIGLTEVVVVDASVNPYDNPCPNVTYLHLPGMTFASRIKFAIDLIKSPFAILVGDDDYLSPSGCAEVMRLITEDSGVASAQARYVTVFQGAKSCKFVGTYRHAVGLRVESLDRNERLIKWLGHYMHSIYAPRRTERLRNIVKSFPENERSPILVEMAYVIADAWIGKHINISDKLYMVRSDIPGSGGKTIQGLGAYIKNHPQGYKVWVDEFCQNFSAATNSDYMEFHKFWDNGIEIYQKVFLPSRRRSTTLLGYLKNLVPPEIKRYFKIYLSLPPIGPSTPVDQWILDSSDFKAIKSHIEQHPL